MAAENVLNDLSASEWIDFTMTCWRTAYPMDVTWDLRKELRTTKSPQAMRDIIKFFTKEGEGVLDPLAGVGSTLIGALLCNRQAQGIELNPRWVKIFNQIKKTYEKKGDGLAPSINVDPQTWAKVRMVQGNCLKRLTTLSPESVDFVFCDPPHGIQGKDERLENQYQSDDFGNGVDLNHWFSNMMVMGEQVHRVLRKKRYWVILMRDRYIDGKYLPLTYKLAERLTTKSYMQGATFALKGIKVWIHEYNKRSLKPYRIGQAFVPNIVHDNLIILSKE